MAEKDKRRKQRLAGGSKNTNTNVNNAGNTGAFGSGSFTPFNTDNNQASKLGKSIGDFFSLQSDTSGNVQRSPQKALPFNTDSLKKAGDLFDTSRISRALGPKESFGSPNDFIADRITSEPNVSVQNQNIEGLGLLNSEKEVLANTPTLGNISGNFEGETVDEFIPGNQDVQVDKRAIVGSANVGNTNAVLRDSRTDNLRNAFVTEAGNEVRFGGSNDSVSGLTPEQAARIQKSLSSGKQVSSFNTQNVVDSIRSDTRGKVNEALRAGNIDSQEAEIFRERASGGVDSANFGADFFQARKSLPANGAQPFSNDLLKQGLKIANGPRARDNPFERAKGNRLISQALKLGGTEASLASNQANTQASIENNRINSETSLANNRANNSRQIALDNNRRIEASKPKIIDPNSIEERRLRNSQQSSLNKEDTKQVNSLLNRKDSNGLSTRPNFKSSEAIRHFGQTGRHIPKSIVGQIYSDVGAALANNLPTDEVIDILGQSIKADGKTISTTEIAQLEASLRQR